MALEKLFLSMNCISHYLEIVVILSLVKLISLQEGLLIVPFLKLFNN